MLKLQAEATFTKEVSFPSPWGEQKINVEFKYLDAEEYEKYVSDMQQSTEGKTEKDLAADVVVGWSGVDTEFTPENFSTLCKKYHKAAGAIFEMWWQTNSQARVEN